MTMSLQSENDIDLIAELIRRGYIVSPAYHKPLSFHRMNPDSVRAFQWEAVHQIAAQLRPDHLRFSCENQMIYAEPPNEERTNHRWSAFLHIP
jgi:hypothetical protein